MDKITETYIKLCKGTEPQIIEESVGKWIKRKFTPFKNKEAMSEDFSDFVSKVLLSYGFSNYKNNGNVRYKRQGPFTIFIAMNGATLDSVGGSGPKDKYNRHTLEITLYENKSPVNTVDKVSLVAKDSWTEQELVDAINKVLLKGSCKLSKSSGNMAAPRDRQGAPDVYKTSSVDPSAQPSGIPDTIAGMPKDVALSKLDNIQSKDQRVGLLKAVMSGWKKLTPEEQKALLS